MRIIFMGTPEFSVSFLEHLMSSAHEIVGVVTQPDRPSGRGRKLTPPPVKIKAEELGLPVLQPEDLRSPETVASLTSLRPDLFVVVAYSILPPVLLAIPPKGSVNIHTSLLPKYRGAAPIQWAIAKGESETGVTIFQLDEKMDHGPIVEQEKVSISLEDRGPEVYAKLLEAGRPALDRALAKIASGNYTPLPQDHELACGARKLKKEDGALDFSKTCLELHNVIRGFFPWPSAYAMHEDQVLKILKSRLVTLEGPSQKASSGALFAFKGALYVGCDDGWLELIEVQPQGKKAQDGISFWNGLQNRTCPCLKKPE